MKIAEFYMRIRHASSRKSTAYNRFVKRTLLKVIQIDFNKQIECNYVNLSNFKSKVLQISKISDGGNVQFITDNGLYGHTFGEKYSIELENVLVDSENNLIYIDTGHKFLLLSESTEWPVEHILSTIKFPRYKQYPEIEVASLGLPNTGFYHWISEDLPIFLNSDASNNYLNFVHSSITNQSILNKLKRSFQLVPKYIYVKKLKFNSKNKDLGKISPFNISILKDFSANLDFDIKNRDAIFYVSRSKSRRSLKNEVELERMFKKLGILVVYAENLDFLDQIKLFSNAKAIIGAHGAGLVHAIWANNCALFEIFEDQPINRCFEWQTLIQGNIYKRFMITSKTNLDLLAHEIYDAIQQL